MLLGELRRLAASISFGTLKTREIKWTTIVSNDIMVHHMQAKSLLLVTK